MITSNRTSKKDAQVNVSKSGSFSTFQWMPGMDLLGMLMPFLEMFGDGIQYWWGKY